jgi:HEAT repeat protein
MKKLLSVAGLVLLITGCGRSTSDLVEQLHAKDASARLHAVKSLKDRRGDQVVAALTESLKDDDAFVRRDAARALGDIGPGAREAVPALTTSARKDKNTHVRQAAADALKRIDPDAAAIAKIK